MNDVTLACSEACANAVEHAKRASRQLVEIEAYRDETHLELRVRDYGSWAEHRQSDTRGRGIGIIDRLMDTVTIESHPDGTEIVMCRDVVAKTSHRRITGNQEPTSWGQVVGTPSGSVGSTEGKSSTVARVLEVS